MPAPPSSYITTGPARSTFRHRAARLARDPRRQLLHSASRRRPGIHDMSLAAPETELSSRGRIPVLDIGAYLAGEAGAAAPLARAIARTCEDTGFLVVANHGVPQHLVDDTFAVTENFFARPEADKLALKIGTYNIGYLPFGGQVVRHSPANKNTRPNFSASV